SRRETKRCCFFFLSPPSPSQNSQTSEPSFTSTSWSSVPVLSPISAGTHRWTMALAAWVATRRAWRQHCAPCQRYSLPQPRTRNDPRVRRFSTPRRVSTRAASEGASPRTTNIRQAP
ncbi:unnamed protein product, partial [Ixodes persulcatus]